MELYKDASKPIPERVEDLLSRMTLEEKAAQLCGNLPASFMRNSEVDMDMLKQNFPYGIGRITQYSTTGLCDAQATAKASNILQKYCMEETRLGIPAALQTESLCGFPVPSGTLFPSMINAGSTWEPELIEEMSNIIGKESRAAGVNSTMSPVVDCARDERWGRVYETFGEDWYMNSQMGVAYVRGEQDDKKGVACIGKHFLGYSETQGGMNCTQARINDRELYEVFATPFEACMKEADLSGVMANYGEIDGINVLANKKISIDLLRNTMGFRGMLTSDGAGVMRLWNHYKLTRTYEEAGLLAKKCGADTEIPVGNAFKVLPQFVREGRLDEAVLDESVRRILTIKFEYGLFENPYIDESREALDAALTNDEKQKLSEKIAADSIILLQNNGVLPLKKDTKVAVIGPHADSLRYPISGYTYPAYIEMADAMRKNKQTSIGGMADMKDQAEKEEKEKKPTSGFGSMFAIHSDEAMDALSDMNSVIRKMNSKTLKEELEARFTVNYAQGCTIMGDDRSGFTAACEAAENSDVVVMALGGNCGWVDVTGGEGIDRSSFDLPGVQEELLETVAKAGKPVVVILFGPQVHSTCWAKDNADAVIQAWMPGPKSGKVLSDVLDGTVNPGGKLTVTVPRSAGQSPTFYNHHVGSGYSDAAEETAAVFKGGYVNEDAMPLYAFGHGLSYTTFKLSDFCIETPEVRTDDTVVMHVNLTNTGDVKGTETVQLYGYFMDANVIRPNKQLYGFKRVELEPGETKTIEFSLSTRLLAYYNEDMKFVVEPGEMEFMIGTSSEDLPCKGSVMFTGEAADVMGRRVYSSTATVK